MWTKNVIETESLKPFPFSFLLQVQYILIKCEKLENICLKLSNSLLLLGSRKFRTRVFRAPNDPGAIVTYFCRKRECGRCSGRRADMIFLRRMKWVEELLKTNQLEFS